MNNEATIARIRQNLSSRGIIKGNEIATQGFLRLGQSVQSTLNSINFNVLQNQGTVLSTERRLNVTDMFTVTHWAMYLVKAGGQPSAAGPPSVGGGVSATPTDIATARNWTYPNPYVFATAANGLPTFLTNNGANALTPFTQESNNMYSIYNGFISVTIDREVVIDSFDTLRFLRVPGSQQQMAQAAAAIAPAAATIGYSAGATFDQWESGNYGFSEVDPQFTLNGIGDNNITINLPAPVSLAGTLSQNFVFLQLRGIRWQNASKLNA